MKNENKDMSKKGFVMLPRVVLFDPWLSATDKEIYSAIRSFRNEKTRKTVHPSRQQVAVLLRQSLSTVKRSILILRRQGHLTWSTGGTGRANTYQFFDTNDGRVMDEPVMGLPVNQGEVTSDPLLGSPKSHQSESNNYYQKGCVLFFGKDKARVSANDEIEIFIPHQRRWAQYSGGDEERFRYGTLTGTLARKAAIADARNVRTRGNS